MTKCPGCGADLTVSNIYWNGFAVEFCLNEKHGMDKPVLWGFNLKEKRWYGLKLVMV